MRSVKSSWTAVALGLVLVAVFSACQIERSSGPEGELRYVKITPDENLIAAPAGSIYELWVLSIEFVSDTLPPIIGLPVPVLRFQWDPYLYTATDVNGDVLPLTSEAGMEVGFDLTPYFVTFVTVEPINDPVPQFPNGPTFVAQQINQESHIARMRNPFDILHTAGPLGGFQYPEPNASYSLISQSNKKGTGIPWRDSLTEGFGIWFCEPRLDDLIILDSAGGWNAFSQTFVDTASGAFNYNVWINRTHPESSFSNFGRVYPQREPDFQFENGFPAHAPQRYGPSEFVGGQGPGTGVGVQLGSNPVFSNGTVIGYRYVSNNQLDTCVVRVDNPALTRCNRDTFAVLTLDTLGVLPRSFRITNGDTSMVSTLPGMLDLGDEEEINELTFGNGFIFEGWEYEAWLIFTDASGIPPLSLGRFKDPEEFDSGNPYTRSGFNFDSNFACPGEDFLTNLPGAIGSPLNVITDPRVEKLWITIEPELFLDPAPNAPNEQLIYLSQYIPKSLPNSDFPRRAMVVRDINPSETGLNEGNFFPTVTVQFLPPPVE